MCERDVVKELKTQIADLTEDRDEALAKVKSKEARLKQVMIKLEHATSDVQSVGHRIAERDKEILTLKAKLETKDKLLTDALSKLKDIHDDSTQETDTDADDSEVDQ